MIRRTLIALLLVGLLGLAATGCPNSDATPPDGNGSNDSSNGDTFQQPPVGIKVGNTAPDFSLLDTSGNLISLGSLRGQAVILNFWQTTCPPCVEEMPLFQEIQQQYASKGLVFLGIDIAESKSKVLSFTQANRLTLTLLLDSQAEVAISYDVIYTPTTFFIDSHGVIQAIKIGQFLGKSQIEQGVDMIMP